MLKIFFSYISSTPLIVSRPILVDFEGDELEKIGGGGLEPLGFLLRIFGLVATVSLIVSY